MATNWESYKIAVARRGSYLLMVKQKGDKVGIVVDGKAQYGPFPILSILKWGYWEEVNNDKG